MFNSLANSSLHHASNDPPRFGFARDVKDLLFGTLPKVNLAAAALLASVSLAQAAEPFGRTLVTASCTTPTPTTVVNLAVASNYYGTGKFPDPMTGAPLGSPIGDLILAFENANSGVCLRVTDNGATATLESHIVAGNASNVDIFFAADFATPLQLYNSNNPPTTVYVSGAPLPYAQGFLAFLSNGIDASGGYDPSGAFSTVTNIAVANPTLAPYGEAAKELLYNNWGIVVTSTPTIQATYTNIAGPLNAVNTGTGIGGSVMAGFVALANICSSATLPAYPYPTTAPAGSLSAHVYSPIEFNSSGVNYNYTPLLQGLVQVVYNRTGQPQSTINAFIAFSTDFTLGYPTYTINSTMIPATSNSAAFTVLQTYCYAPPTQAPLLP